MWLTIVLWVVIGIFALCCGYFVYSEWRGYLRDRTRRGR